jgi:tripartite-type tricarboxylate transporter receptor subunit TctC
MKYRNIIVTLIAGALAVISTAAVAQNYPSRPVKLISGNPPGGPSDLALRGVAEVLSKKLSQSFYVENRPGADGILFGEQCARAPRDGYTFCLGDAYSMVLNNVLRSDMPYDPFKDIAPVVHVGFLPSGFWVHRSVPAASLRDLLKLATDKPDSVNWAAFGASSSIYLGWLKNAKNVRFAEIPYKSAVDAWRAVLSGESHVSIYGLRSGQSQATGDVRLFAVNTDERLPDLPNVPTFKEEGFEAVMVVWFGLFAPVGTPDQIIQTINTAVSTGLHGDPEMKKKYLDNLGLAVYGPSGKSSASFASFYASERQRYLDLAKLGGLK